MLRRVKPEASALIHDYVTETYYILSGSGTFVTGGQPRRREAHRSDARQCGHEPDRHAHWRRGAQGQARRHHHVPAGTPHSFSELDGPISYLVYRFEPVTQEIEPNSDSSGYA